MAKKKRPIVAAGAVAPERLRGFVERIERLDEERRELAANIREVYAEAKEAGFEPTAVREMVRLRRLDDAERRARAALIETYAAALGLYADTPLGRASLRAAGAGDEPAPSEAAAVH